MSKQRNETLQALCRDYLLRLRYMAKMLGESYRKSESRGVFDRIKKLRRVGIYSKVSALIYKNKRNENERTKK